MISKLEGWYLKQCNGEWEHSYGVKIDTLDNPGWTIKIDLKETDRQDATLKRYQNHRSDQDWLECWTEMNQFHIACGPLNLSEGIEYFVSWFDSGA